VAIERDPAEYREQLDTELRHLRRSGVEYDAGDRTEAQRLSLIVRKLVHDKRNATSLLTHLGIKDDVRFFDTRPQMPPGFPPGAMMIHSGLVMTRMTIGGDVDYAPFLMTDDPLRSAWTGFHDWWTSTVVSDQEGNDFARSDFVLSVANQDGGAHIDSKLNEKYGAITRRNSLGQEGSTATGEMRPLGPSIALATVRQIAFELDASLRLHPGLGLWPSVMLQRT
jgi:hypothetical protein